MMRVLKVLGIVLLAAIILPPLWYTVFPVDPAPPLPDPGRRVELPDGTGINVLDEGEGPPVVLIHGLPGSAYEWRETSRELVARGFRVLAYDRVGYGHSDPRKSGSYTPESNADELVALLEALDLRDAAVVGWSYGGATAFSAAAKHKPERMRRLILVGTGGPDSADAEPPSPSVIGQLFYSDPVLRWRSAVPPLGRGLISVLSNVAFSEGPQPDWWIPGVIGNLARWDTLLTFRGESFGMTPENTKGFVATEIQVPTLILHGDDDRLAPVEIGRYLASVIPDARLVEYPGASHMLPVTHAKELADEIAKFNR